jgi:hypothetical protein
LLVSALALAAGGCGGEEAARPRPTLAPAVADRLAAQSDAIAEALDAGDVCTAAVRADELQDETLRAINAGQVPPAFQEDLTARVNELVNTVNCERADEDDDDDEGEGNGKGKKGKKKNEDDEAEPVVTLPVPTESTPTEPTPTETGG